MTEASTPKLDNAIGSFLGNLASTPVLALCALLYGFFHDLIWLGLVQSGPSGWFILILSVGLSITPAKWLAKWIISKTRNRSIQGSPSLPRGFNATITHPQNNHPVNPGWIPIEGSYSGRKEHYWLIANRGNEYYVHGWVVLNAEGTWRESIYLQEQTSPRSVTIILAWASDEMHSILESWKNRCRETNNWNALKMAPPSGHFIEIDVRTLQVLPVAAKSSIKLLSTSLEHVLSRGKTFEIEYEIDVTGEPAKDIWLGASFQDKAGTRFFNKNEDKSILLTKGKGIYRRNFTIAKDATLGEQMLGANVWQGVVGDSRQSKVIASRPATRIRIVE